MTKEELRVWLAIFNEAYVAAVEMAPVPSAIQAQVIFACLVQATARILAK